MNYWTQSEKNIYVAGHRGFCARYPENTILSFEKAIEVGVDQIETDIRITKDGEFVLIHDAGLERTTNGTGKVCDYTLSQLKQLDAGGGERIPTLRELFMLVKDHPTMTLNLELKEYPVEGWEEKAFYTADKTIEMVEEFDFSERCIINSFNQKLNEYVYTKYGGRYKQHLFYPEKYLKTEGCRLPLYSFGYCVCFFGDGFSVEDVNKFRKETGLRIWAPASVKDAESLERALPFGIELITCNNPDEVLKLLRERGLHK